MRSTSIPRLPAASTLYDTDSQAACGRCGRQWPLLWPVAVVAASGRCCGQWPLWPPVAVVAASVYVSNTLALVANRPTHSAPEGVCVTRLTHNHRYEQHEHLGAGLHDDVLADLQPRGAERPAASLVRIPCNSVSPETM